MTIYRRRLASIFAALRATFEKRRDASLSGVGGGRGKDAPDHEAIDEAPDADDLAPLATRRALAVEERDATYRLPERIRALPPDWSVWTLRAGASCSLRIMVFWAVSRAMTSATSMNPYLSAAWSPLVAAADDVADRLIGHLGDAGSVRVDLARVSLPPDRESSLQASPALPRRPRGLRGRGRARAPPPWRSTSSTAGRCPGVRLLAAVTTTAPSASVCASPAAAAWAAGPARHRRLRHRAPGTDLQALQVARCADVESAVQSLNRRLATGPERQLAALPVLIDPPLHVIRKPDVLPTTGPAPTQRGRRRTALRPQSHQTYYPYDRSSQPLSHRARQATTRVGEPPGRRPARLPRNPTGSTEACSDDSEPRAPGPPPRRSRARRPPGSTRRSSDRSRGRGWTCSRGEAVRGSTRGGPRRQRAEPSRRRRRAPRAHDVMVAADGHCQEARNPTSAPPLQAAVDHAVT